MKILVINAGSSSIKYQLMGLDTAARVLASGLVEKIGEGASRIAHKAFVNGERKEAVRERQILSHKIGMGLVVEMLTDPDHGVIGDTGEIAGVGHRVVHCGEAYSDPVRIDDHVIETIREYFALSPLHNPANLMGIETAMEFFPKAPQVAVFDTAFHQTMPPHAYLYALPYEYYARHRVRRYGFHGTSHKYITGETARVLGVPRENVNLISIHLGNGCSMAAVKGGKCIDTSMGLTPLEGLIMGTRSGDLDPGCFVYLNSETGMTLPQITGTLNKSSGLKGLCGTNDVREVLEKVAAGDERATLALNMYCYRIRKYIGAYVAALGAGLHAIVFTAGVGENAVLVRQLACENLGHIGIDLDAEANRAPLRGTREVQKPSSRVKILVMPTDEELQIARETQQVIEALGA